MNSATFTKWLLNLAPQLPSQSVLVMDNAGKNATKINNGWKQYYLSKLPLPLQLIITKRLERMNIFVLCICDSVSCVWIL